ncbi:Aldo-ket-red domain-containing protein [Aphelenchoides fujianensis]|nr:Aldo-ket-red domain-containing protein [Aphelenchoides fujianensis]
MYFNEASIGEVLQEYISAGKLKRSDVFITTKLPFESHEPAFECHILWPQKELVALCKRLNVVVTSYATIGSPGRGASPIPNDQFIKGDCMNQAAVQELAKKYGKTPAQILLRHTVQQGICVIPKSTNPDRLKQNLSLFDFKLTPEDQQKLDAITERARLFTFNFARHHKSYPFER